MLETRSYRCGCEASGVSGVNAGGGVVIFCPVSYVVGGGYDGWCDSNSGSVG